MVKMSNDKIKMPKEGMLSFYLHLMSKAVLKIDKIPSFDSGKSGSGQGIISTAMVQVVFFFRFPPVVIPG